MASETVVVGSWPALEASGFQRLEYLAPRDFFLDSKSRFLKRADPLRGEVAPPYHIWLDQYAAWRQQVGDPIHPDELEYVAARSSEAMARSIRSRTSPDATPRSPSAAT